MPRTTDDDDRELLVAARADAAAFGVFYRRHVREVHAYFRRRAASPDVAFDLAAETFAQALRSVDRYEPGQAPARAWLFGIARNVLLESLRRGVVEDRARRALAMEPIVLDDDALAALEREDAARPATEALEELPGEQREAIVARHVDGLEYAEIAARLRCSESVVRQRVSRGLRVLRERLREAPRG
ncbi:MAG TPA: RNA polymerase sigma factor [Solirubrobacteraceae bacterium]|nr:RNA polymerase sigma factor [Solirubrobacteraceae bacterium]